MQFMARWLLYFTVLMSLANCTLPNSTPTPPISIPIALHKANTVLETEVEIEQNDRIKLLLIFYVNDQPGDRDRLMTLLGGLGETGIAIPLKVKITKYGAPKEIVILEKTYTTVGIIGYSQTSMDREIDRLNIKSGKYRIRLETTAAFPQLSYTPVRFNLYYVRAPK